MVRTYEELVMDDGHLSVAENVRHEMDLRHLKRSKVT